MAVMDLTTQAEVLEALEVSAGSMKAAALAAIDGWITMYSDLVALPLARWVEQTARTEQYDLRPNQAMLFLRGYPVLETPAAVVKIDTQRAFPSSAVEDTSNYYLDLARGKIKWSLPPSVWGPGIVQVAYTGGMAEDAAAFVAAFPGLSKEVAAQVAYHYRRRHEPGGNVQVGAGGRQYQGALKFLPGLDRAINAHRRQLSG